MENTIKVAQCWDDGVVDDIRVIEILRKHGAKASFNLNYSLHKPERSAPWRYRDLKDVQRLGTSELTSVYEGFLVANHTSTHPHLTKIPSQDALREIQEGKEALEQLFGYKITGFAYPFGDFNTETAQMLRDTGHAYGRTTQYTTDVTSAEDMMALPSNGHFLAPDFWERFDAASPSGVFYFWGHSYELVTDEDWAGFDAKIARLSANPRVEWVDPPTLFPAP